MPESVNIGRVGVLESNFPINRVTEPQHHSNSSREARARLDKRTLPRPEVGVGVQGSKGRQSH